MSILVTGGAGYIGSHTCVELLNVGYDVIVADNLYNSSIEVLKRVQHITGKEVKFYQTDIQNKAGLSKIFTDNLIEAVVHFAGLKSVEESVIIPLKYYRNNILGSLTLFEVMQTFQVKKIIFSSSATVYGKPAALPIKEDFPLSAANPYGRTKLYIENILKDIYQSDPEWNIIMLRYFNPIGAHESGLIGDNPRGIPNNLVPYITQVAIGSYDSVRVFGDDYDTPDGSGIRDYIHVSDLAAAHCKALEKLNTSPGLCIYNLGTGQGISVFELIKAFSRVCEKEIPYIIKPRRPGDIAACYADATLAMKELGWRSERGIEEMCEDAWRWQKNNPNGYDD